MSHLHRTTWILVVAGIHLAMIHLRRLVWSRIARILPLFSLQHGSVWILIDYLHHNPAP